MQINGKDICSIISWGKAGYGITYNLFTFCLANRYQWPYTMVVTHHVLQQKHKNMKKGFTLLELLATIAIMAVLIAAVLPFISNYTSWARTTQAHRSALLAADAINRYNALVGTSPLGDAGNGSPITGGEGLAVINARLLGKAQTIEQVTGI